MTAPLRLALPDSWRLIPLHDAPSRDRAIAAYVASRFRGDDSAPLLKADLCARLTRQAVDAGLAGGTTMALSEMVVGQLPLPATLTVYEVIQHRVAGSALDQLRDRLLSESPGAGGALAATHVPAGRLLRHSRVAGASGALPGAGGIDVLLVDYWLEDPDDGGLTLLSFSSTLVVWQEQLLHLFDAIAEHAVRTPSASQEVSQPSGH